LTLDIGEDAIPHAISAYEIPDSRVSLSLKDTFLDLYNYFFHNERREKK